MKKEQGKTDYRFLAVISLLLILFIAGGIYFNGMGDAVLPDPVPLPDTADESVYNGLVLSEVLTNNGGVYISEDGLCCDFVEVFNGSTEAIELFGYGLSDTTDKIKWAFPDITIQPGEYIVVNLTGQSMDGLNANFKLSSKGGERLILVNNKGKVIDALDTPSMGKNQSLIRNVRQWQISGYPTPGFENSEDGLQAYRDSLLIIEEQDLVINEFLCKNEGNYINNNARTDGYIEFINKSDRIISLSNYYLSDDISAPFKFNLPKVFLSPGEIYMLYTGENSYASEEYTGFGLQNKTGSIFIARDGKIVTKLDYENIPNGCAYVLGDNGEYYVSCALSPGYANDANGVDSFQKANMTRPAGLIINEVMSSNNSVIPQNGYQFYDWIELYNGSAESISLADYALTNDTAEPALFALPDVTLDPGAYYVVMCSGNTDLSNDSYIHANFKIGKSESIYLMKGSNVKDSVFVYGIPLEYSYSRGKSYGWGYSSRPTPGSANIEGSRVISPAPEIELPSGVYNGVSSLSVAISGQGRIYYTTDGSEPTTSSRVYTGPLSIGYSTVVKAAALLSGSMLSPSVCCSYIVNDPHDVPVVSIAVNPWQFSNMYYNYTQNLRYPAYFELFEEDDSASSPCGIALSGLTGRRYNKKNYALRFDGEYGATSLDYKVFDDLDCSSFDSIVIRGGSNAESSLPWKDEFASKLAQDCLLTRSSKTCALYINGAYRGFYNIREKITPTMIADHYNVDKSKVSIARWTGDLECGENTWLKAMQWGESHDLANDANYYEFCRMVDVEELCDLWIFQMYMNNPDIYNIRVYSHPDIDGGRCKFIYFDLDLGFYGPETNYLSAVPFNYSGYAQDLAGHSYDMRVNLALLRNTQFRELFIERLSYHLHHTLSTDNTLALFDYYTNLYAPEIWRDMYTNGYDTSWYDSNIYQFRYLISIRTWVLMDYARYFFGLSSAEMSKYFGELW
jgi:hypothetical protein